MNIRDREMMIIKIRGSLDFSLVVVSRNWITPAHELEDYFFPQPEWFIDAINERILPLEGHVNENDFTEAEQLDRNARGI